MKKYILQSMINMLFFGGYLLIHLILFSGIILLFVRVRRIGVFDTRTLTRVMQLIISILFLISVFGGYKILTGEILPGKQEINNQTINL